MPAKIGTQFARNGSLKVALDRRQVGSPPPFMDETKIAIIATGISLGMRFIHWRGVTHRDLKPENIFIDSRGFPLIGDLGCGRFADSGLTLTQQVGTLLYMAPEMYDDEEYTNAVDVFSFALILYELLVGETAFPRTITPMNLMKRVAGQNRPSLPASMNVTMKEIIARCWSANAGARESFDEIISEFEGIKYRMTPRVDPAKVSQYVKSVLQQE
jgi:serine/threonine protein kinase